MQFCYISSHGRIQKNLTQRALNFVRNNWPAPTAVISLAVAAIGIYWHFQDKKLNATSGVISSPIQSGPMSISVGSAEFRMLSKDGVVFDEGGEPLLSIRLLNGKLFVTTRVRDASGGLVAEMSDNEWKQGPVILDRNYTQDALEIRDGTGRVVLQVANLGNTVDVAAIFHCRNGWSYMMGPIAGEGSAMELRPPGQPLKSEIPPICDYPSDLHFGSCPGVDRLRQMTSEPHAHYTLYFPVHLCL
jgi:hypothetical protein